MKIMSNPNGNLAVMDAPGNRAIAPQKYNPISPVGTAGGLKQLLEAQKDSIARMLPKHITPERLFKTLLVAANRDPKILQCTQSSCLETVNRAAELGLDLSGTLGEAYPVPFNNKVKYTDGNGRVVETWTMQLTLIIGYRGMEKLAWQSGEVESIDAEAVCENDHFIFKKGTEVLVDFQPNLRGDRGDFIGAYACVKMKSGGKLARFLTTSDIEKIRSKAKSKDSPAWRDWWDEMARKCALKRTLKDAPLSTEKFVKALEADDDLDLSDVISVEPTGRQANSLNQRLAATAPAPQLESSQTGNDHVNASTGELIEDSQQADSQPPVSVDAQADTDVSEADTDQSAVGESAPVDPAVWMDATKFENLLVGHCVENKIAESTLNERLAAWCKKLGSGKLVKMEKLLPAQRKELWAAVQAGTFFA
jgi:recombination protein RecT